MPDYLKLAFYHPMDIGPITPTTLETIHGFLFACFLLVSCNESGYCTGALQTLSHLIIKTVLRGSNIDSCLRRRKFGCIRLNDLLIVP